MAIKSVITDESTGNTVHIVGGNALAVNPPHPSVAFNAELAVDNTVVNIVPAKASHGFCMTGLLLTGDKNVSAVTDATVQLYVADSATATAANAITSLFVMPVARSSARDITGILVESGEGRYINGVTSDDNVFVTVLGYYLRIHNA